MKLAHLSIIVAAAASIAFAETPQLASAQQQHDQIIKIAKATYDAAVRKAKQTLIEGLEAELSDAMAKKDLQRALTAKEAIAKAEAEIAAHTPAAPAEKRALRFHRPGRWVPIQKGAKVFTNRGFVLAHDPAPALAGMKFWQTANHPAQIAAAEDTRVIILSATDFKATTTALRAHGFTPMAAGGPVTMRGATDAAMLWEKDMAAGEKVVLPTAVLVIAK